MAANTIALMDALSGDTPFKNLHIWNSTLAEVYSEGQYSYTPGAILDSIKTELAHLGVDNTDTIQGPPDIGPG